jgi:hypothetical protein
MEVYPITHIRVTMWEFHVQLPDGAARSFRRTSYCQWEQLLGNSWEPLYPMPNEELVDALERLYKRTSLA